MNTEPLTDPNPTSTPHGRTAPRARVLRLLDAALLGAGVGLCLSEGGWGLLLALLALLLAAYRAYVGE